MGAEPGQVQELPPLPGDTVGFAFALNNNGQVVGSSGTCANTATASGATWAARRALGKRLAH